MLDRTFGYERQTSGSFQYAGFIRSLYRSLRVNSPKLSGLGMQFMHPPLILIGVRNCLETCHAR